MQRTTLTLLAFLANLVLAVTSSCTTDPVLINGGVPEEPGANQGEPPVPGPPCTDNTISFKEQILPIMIASCGYSGCHSQESREDGVVLVDYASIRREVRPGDPNDSDLYESITETGDDIMPPRPAAALSTSQRNAIRDWIRQGANETDCAVPCTPENINFSADIQPLIQDYCAGCHGNNHQDGGVNLSSHAEILRYVADGSLVGSMEHAISFLPMPPAAVRMPACKVLQVKNWIAAGAPNN